jgi:hypothetical protein
MKKGEFKDINKLKIKLHINSKNYKKKSLQSPNLRRLQEKMTHRKRKNKNLNPQNHKKSLNNLWYLW